MSILHRGLHGEPVRLLQEKLGVTADGIFGSGTEAALRKYQKEHGLAVDGVAGPDTFTEMGLHALVLLRVGSRGSTVKKLQQGLGIGADGDFGHGTEKAVKTLQQANHIDVDGIAGPQTLAFVPGFKEVVTPAVVAQSVVPPNYTPIDPVVAKAAVATEPPPPPPPQGVIAKVESEIASVGKSIWNTLKSIV
jgi:peptidoglycan hydrolase-like protein with peptidoglycan-binding domain